MTQSVFVYGTLMYPQVLHALLERVPTTSKAVIHGFKRYNIKGQVFPGVIQSPTEKVEGILLQELTPSDMVILDEFEGEEYYKFPVQPQILDGPASGTTAEASVYIWQDSLRPLLYGDWDPEAFRETHLESYVEMCERFAEELKELQVKPTSRPLGFAAEES